MRTKTLLLTAALGAAFVASSMAQVYSVNIVGYANVSLPAGQFRLVSNPLDDGTNTVVSLGAQLANKSAIQTWNGTSFDAFNKSAAGAFSGWNTNTSIPVGQGFFIRSSNSITYTFVGNVIVNPPGTNTTALPAGLFVLKGSAIPFSGDIAGPNALNLGPSLANKSTIQTWNGSGFDAFNKSAAGAFNGWNTNTTIDVAQGFFVRSSNNVNWVQILLP
jgi:uncharacterized protein YukE